MNKFGYFSNLHTILKEEMSNRIIFYIIMLLSINVVQGHILDKQNRIVDILHTIDNSNASVTLTSLKKPCIYKAVTQNNAYVVRFNDWAPTFVKSLENEMQRYAAQNDFGPKILFNDLQEGVIIMDYLEDRYDASKLDDTIPLFVASMKKIHSAPFVGRQMHLFTTNVLNRTKSLGKEPATRVPDINVDELHGSLARLAWLFDNLQDHVLVHGDLHSFNIFLSDKTCMFIDFETVHMDSPFVDLAHIAASYGMNKEQEKKLLELYFNRHATVEDFIKLTAMKCFVCAKFICWMLESLTTVSTEKLKLDTITLNYVPLLHVFVKTNPDAQNPEWRYALAISTVKELEDLLKQLDFCLIGDYRLLLPTDMQAH